MRQTDKYGDNDHNSNKYKANIAVGVSDALMRIRQPLPVQSSKNGQRWDDAYSGKHATKRCAGDA